MMSTLTNEYENIFTLFSSLFPEDTNDELNDQEYEKKYHDLFNSIHQLQELQPIILKHNAVVKDLLHIFVVTLHSKKEEDILITPQALLIALVNPFSLDQLLEIKRYDFERIKRIIISFQQALYSNQIH